MFQYCAIFLFRQSAKKACFALSFSGTQKFLAIVLAVATQLSLAQLAWAHGDSFSGGIGGVNTVGAEISTGESLGIRYNRKKYNLFSDAQLLAFQTAGQDVHQHSVEEALLLSYNKGISENWDISFQLELPTFSNFSDNSDAFALANNTISRTDISEGLGDLFTLARYRFLTWDMAGGDHHLAALMGIKLPTGNYRERTNNGELVGTHNQPGSGSTDFFLGSSYTGHFFDELFGVSSDVIFRTNNEGAGEFRAGNSIQTDLAISYKPHRDFTPFVEFNGFFQQRDMEFDEVKPNSGTRIVFMTVGFQYTFLEKHGFFLSYSEPIFQDLQGIQSPMEFKFDFGYTISWGS